MKLIKALFLDRDGVINEDVRYPHKPEQIVFREGIFELCKKAIDKGYLIVVITNQAGVAKGYFTENDVKYLHKWMGEQFLNRGITISAFFYCPFHKDASVPEYKVDSVDRKPNPGLILKAVKEFSIDIASSIMVGDKLSDRIKLPYLRSIIIKSGYTNENYDVCSLTDVENYL